MEQLGYFSKEIVGELFEELFGSGDLVTVNVNKEDVQVCDDIEHIGGYVLA